MMIALASGAGAATPATAAAPATPDPLKAQMSEKYDTKLPIEISADNLEVLQHENKAIFRGNVIAVQGKIRLKSDVMIIHYKEKGGTPTPAPVKPASAPATDSGVAGSITLIEVEGNVFAATPEESAKGDKGDYVVADKLLHLYGKNVVLTRDKNILKGTELVYNLETGRSVLTDNGTEVGEGNKGRVRGVFVPADKPQGKGTTKTAAPVTPVTSATITTPTPANAPITTTWPAASAVPVTPPTTPGAVYSPAQVQNGKAQ